MQGMLGQIFSSCIILYFSGNPVCTRLDELAACLRSQEEEFEDEECEDVVEDNRLVLQIAEESLDQIGEVSEVDTEDKETNTECVFLPEKGCKRREEPNRTAMVIKRSQTFSPSAAVAKSQYVCRVS